LKGNNCVTFDFLPIHLGCDLLVPMKPTDNSLRLAAALFCAASTLFLTPASYAGVRHINLNSLERGEDRGANSRHHKEGKEDSKNNSKQDSKDTKDQSSSDKIDN
jgi:hypothetical protein